MKPLYYLVIFLFYFFIQIAVSCESPKNKVVKEGEKLARTYCVSCHAFPDPSLLNKKAWSEGVLPRMAELMYVEDYYSPYNPNGPEGNVPETREAPKNLFPMTTWNKIVYYYLTSASDKPLERTEKILPVKMELTNFKVRPVHDLGSYPLTTFINFDTVTHNIIIGDGASEVVFILNKQLEKLDSMEVPLGVTDIDQRPDGIKAISMGILKPSDEKLGKLSLIASGKKPVTLIDSLRRPIEASYADLNNDGKEDIIISEFGYRKGSLSWFENKGDLFAEQASKKYERHVLSALPGAISSIIYDFNNDGKQDIAALMAQGDESIFIYYNEGNGKFKEKRVLQFPPVYGANHMELTDINKDGYIDIITTNGDNGDMSIIIKPYHGIRIFLNDGQNNFKEKVFLPVHGVQKAVAKDFDGDGDIDLASISFFPDYEHLPEESFIYFENKGDLTFDRFSFPEETNGRWMTMDAADMDGDGDIDISLGSAFFTLGKVPQSFKEKWQKQLLSAMILENTTHDRTKNN